MERRGPSVLWTALGLALAVGCTSSDELTEEEWKLVEELSPRPDPEDPTNELVGNPDAELLGELLYFDAGLANCPPGDQDCIDRQVSCATCHNPDTAFATNAASNLGVGWVPRNTPTTLDVARYPVFFWDGRRETAWETVAEAVQVSKTQANNPLRIAHFLADSPHGPGEPDYADLYERAVGAPLPDVSGWPADGKMPRPCDAPPSDLEVVWEGQLSDADQVAARAVFETFAKSIAAYLHVIVSGDSPFDDFVAGDHEALTAAQRRGLKLFVGKAGCVECHRGPNFTDGEFHNIGVEQEGEHVFPEDTGRTRGLAALACNPFGDGTAPEEERGDPGAFRTPSLRNVARTAPYMHTGSVGTLEDVVRFYDWGGDNDDFFGEKAAVMVPLGLDEVERADLVAFLESLDSHELPDARPSGGP